MNRYILVVAALLLLVGCKDQDTLQSSVTSPVNPSGKLLKVGSVAQDFKEEIKLFSPLADYLAKGLEAHGYSGGEVVVSSSVEEMAAYLERGEVDIYLDSPFPALKASQTSGAVPFLQRWKYGLDNYYSLIYTRTDTDLYEVADLQGEMIAFDVPSSTSGFLLPFTLLADKGYHLQVYDDPETQVPAEQVGYSFAGEDVNILAWVLAGKVDVGVTNNHRFDNFGDNKDSLRVLARSAAVPPDVVLHRRDLPQAQVDVLTTLLLSTADSEVGKQLLADLQGTTNFETFSTEEAEALATIQRLLPQVAEKTP